MSIEIEFLCGQIQHYSKDELRNFQYFEALFCSGMKDAEKASFQIDFSSSVVNFLLTGEKNNLNDFYLFEKKEDIIRADLFLQPKHDVFKIMVEDAKLCIQSKKESSVIVESKQKLIHILTFYNFLKDTIGRFFD